MSRLRPRSGRVSAVTGALRVRNYRLFITGQAISLTGTWMQFVALDWLVLELSNDSGTALGTVTALQFAPVALLTMMGGKLADTYDKRRLLIMVNSAWATVAAILSVLALTGTIRLWHIYVLTAALGTVKALESPARQSFAGELVGPTLMPTALALNASSLNLARILGPAIGGVLIAWLGTGAVFAVTVATFLGPLAGLLLMRPGDLNRLPQPEDGSRIREGLRYLLGRRDLLVVLALLAVVGMAALQLQLVLALLSKTVFERDASSFGLLGTALGAGALIGALLLTGRPSRPTLAAVAAAGATLGALELALGVASEFWMALAVLVPLGATMMIFVQSANQRIQMGADPAYRGRVMAVYLLVLVGANPISAPLLGALAERHGGRSPLFVGGTVALATGVVTVAAARWRAGRAPAPADLGTG
jgi:MFS family permease